MISDANKKNINLLPMEFRYGFFKRILFYQESHPKKFLLCLSCGLAGLFIIITISQGLRAGSYGDKISKLETDIHRMQAESKELAGVMNQVSEAQQTYGFQVSLLNKRLEFLKSQYNFGHHWAASLKELKGVLPEGVWLIGVKTEDYYIKIAGGALKEELVSDFMAALRNSPAFSNVSFNYTQNSQIGRTKVVLFEVICSYDLGFRGAKAR